MLIDLIEQYIFRLSIFYCKDIDFDDKEFRDKIIELEKYIKEKVGEDNV